MNVQLANVISDIVGDTGQEDRARHHCRRTRTGRVLAKMKNVRIAPRRPTSRNPCAATGARSICCAGPGHDLVRCLWEQLAACDRQLEVMLAALQQDDVGEPGKAKRRSRARNAPKFDVRAYLFGMCGVDLTRINGIDTTTALKVISEVGPDMSRFKSAKHFASWLGLCPGTKISGGKGTLGRQQTHGQSGRTGIAIGGGGFAQQFSRLSAPISAACAPAWTEPRRSPPRHTSWHA